MAQHTLQRRHGGSDAAAAPSQPQQQPQQQQQQQQQQQACGADPQPRPHARAAWLQQQHPQLLSLAAGAVSTLLWMFVSSALIVYNNNLYKAGFPYPMIVTGIGQLFSVLVGLLLSGLGAMPLRRPPSSAAELAALVPIVASTAATMALGNAAYMHLSLSFIQILKTFTPALTLAVGALAGVERLSLSLVASVLLIAAGTGAAVLAESDAPSYSAYGLAVFMASALTEASRVVCSQLLLGPCRYNSADVLVYVGLPAGLTLIGCSLLFEAPAGMLAAAAAMMPAQPRTFVTAAVMSSAVNLTSYLAIATTSSLTFKVSGCLKNLGVVWYGVATHGDHVTPGHLAGYAVSIGGFVLHARTRLAQHAAAAAAGSRAAGGAAPPPRAKAA